MSPYRTRPGNSPDDIDIFEILAKLSPRHRDDLESRLVSMVLPRRLARMDAILARRTRRLTVVFEDIYHPHNASAVMRTAECFGLQDVHVVESERPFRPSKDVIRGAGRWLTLHRHRYFEDLAATIRQNGFRLAATSTDPENPSPEQVSLEQPLALCFGTEETGLSPAAMAAADVLVHVPMDGFTESLNVSVTAALCLRDLARRLRRGDGWQLTATERADLRLRWIVGEGQKTRAVTVGALREWGLVG